MAGNTTFAAGRVGWSIGLHGSQVARVLAGYRNRLRCAICFHGWVTATTAIAASAGVAKLANDPPTPAFRLPPRGRCRTVEVRVPDREISVAIEPRPLGCSDLAGSVKGHGGHVGSPEQRRSRLTP